MIGVSDNNRLFVPGVNSLLMMVGCLCLCRQSTDDGRLFVPGVSGLLMMVSCLCLVQCKEYTDDS